LRWAQEISADSLHADEAAQPRCRKTQSIANTVAIDLNLVAHTKIEGPRYFLAPDLTAPQGNDPQIAAFLQARDGVMKTLSTIGIVTHPCRVTKAPNSIK
jgi:hypothetical protein